MTIAQIVATAVGGLILALITGLITKNVIIAILFPVLLIGLLLMWRRIKEEAPTKPEEEKEEIIDTGEDQVQPSPQVNNYQQPMQNQSQPPVSTNYPPRQSLR